MCNCCLKFQLIRKLQEIHGEDNQNKDGTGVKRIIVRVGSAEGEGEDEDESAYADTANDSDPDFDAATAEGENPLKRSKVDCEKCCKLDMDLELNVEINFFDSSMSHCIFFA